MQEVKDLIDGAANIVVFTGAGISTASGIPDFRSNKGLAGADIKFEEILSIQHFKKNPEQFWNDIFYTLKWDELSAKEPNIGHEWIASLQQEGKNVTVITQNIDGLHQKAGSEKVLELHGNLHQGYCLKHKHIHDISYAEKEIPRCPVCEAPLKPLVVLYGEDLPEFYRAIDYAIKADVYITMGTSLNVFPANTLVNYARDMNKAKTILINQTATSLDSEYDIIHHMNIVDFVKQYQAL